MPSRKQFSILSLMQWLLPVVLSLAAGWGGAQFAQGASAQRLVTVEAQVQTNRQERQAETRELRDKTITREEFDLIRDDLREIKVDVRELRQALSK